MNAHKCAYCTRRATWDVEYTDGSKKRYCDLCYETHMGLEILLGIMHSWCEDAPENQPKNNEEAMRR